LTATLTATATATISLRHAEGPARIPSFEQIRTVHRAMRSE